jgi:multidrug efflux pump subunit AcrA (membrane-fusion protein)
MRKWLRSISILALLALVVGFVLYDRFWRPAPVEAIEIQPTTLAVELSGTGRLDTHLSAVVSTRIQGRIERIEFDQGDAVSAEQVICRLDDSDLQRQVEISEASVDVARAAITRAEAEATRASAALALAEREAQRIRDAAERSAVSASELDRVVQQAAIAAADAARPKWGGPCPLRWGRANRPRWRAVAGVPRSRRWSGSRAARSEQLVRAPDAPKLSRSQTLS